MCEPRVQISSPFSLTYTNTQIEQIMDKSKFYLIMVICMFGQGIKNGEQNFDGSSYNKITRSQFN